ncbi:MAG: hypothetical protein GDA43_25665 [Hormoscilla sp. SP5CHS1]|nr:hypothetical protein [Hormoscilla sp. SP12CHS1]MBC6456142.1 hypothetical protein [Hormoscilla sp. SP5CHS1]
MACWFTRRRSHLIFSVPNDRRVAAAVLWGTAAAAPPQNQPRTGAV